MEKYQKFNPFKFIIYSGRAGRRPRKWGPARGGG